MKRIIQRPEVRLYSAILTFFLLTYIAGSHGVGAIRLPYIAGCLAIAYWALRLGIGYHFEAVITLFAFSPYLRRIVDFSAGFNTQGIMLVGPLLAAMLPAIGLPAAMIGRNRPFSGSIGPNIVILSGFVYAALLSELGGHYVPAMVGLIKAASVALYGLWLLYALDEPRVLMRHGARAFSLTMPIIGIYGVVQYLNPSVADQFWMVNAAMDSIGSPEAQKVRVFSTMNSPASLATFLMCGMLFVGFLRGKWAILLACIPAAITLLLSQVRTSWIALVVAILYTTLFARTSARAVFIAVTMLGISTFAVFATPLGDVISTRLQTMSSSPSEDGSARVRLDEFNFLLEHAEDYMIGLGYDRSDVSQVTNGNLAVQASDGMVVHQITNMGFIVGLIWIFTVVWIAVKAIASVDRQAETEFVVAATLILGQISLSPLTDTTGGESGILFWSLVAVACRMPSRLERRFRENGLVSVEKRLRHSAQTSR